MGRPFAALLAVVSAMAEAVSLAKQNGTGHLALQAELHSIAGGYKSRGKGGKRSHRGFGTAVAQRAARKAKNVKRNRKAHRG